MGVLLFLLGLLAAASGGLKLRSRARLHLGISPLAVLEAVVGVLMILGTGVGLVRMRPLAWAVVAVVLVLLGVSSIAHVRQAVRQASGGKRQRRNGWRATSRRPRMTAMDDAKAMDDTDPPLSAPCSG